MRKPYFEMTSEQRRAENAADRAFTEKLRDGSRVIVDRASQVATPAAATMAATATDTLYSSIIIDELRAIRNELADIREALAR